MKLPLLVPVRVLRLGAAFTAAAALIAGVMAPIPAYASTVAATLSYASTPVTVPADDCVTVDAQWQIGGIANSTYWAAEAVPHRGFAQGASDQGNGPSSMHTDLEVCADSVSGTTARFDVSIELMGNSDPGLGTGYVDTTITSTLTLNVKIPTHLTLKKSSGSRLSGTVSGAKIPKLVTVWIRPAGSDTFRKFGVAHVSRNGGWHLSKTLPYGSYKASTAGASTHASSAKVSVKKPAVKPASPSYPAGASAICRDGTYSYSAHRQGTCSWHGGVATWL